jgi:hypothetical protein
LLSFVFKRSALLTTLRLLAIVLGLVMLGGCGASSSDRLDRALSDVQFKATRADIFQAWGAPAARTIVDGDEFWMYFQKPEMQATGETMMSIWGPMAGYPPAPVNSQGNRRIILRFDEMTGLLKGWSVSQ